MAQSVGEELFRQGSCKLLGAFEQNLFHGDESIERSVRDAALRIYRLSVAIDVTIGTDGIEVFQAEPPGIDAPMAIGAGLDLAVAG